MNREIVLEKMFEISNMISDYKKEILNLEDKKIDLFSKVNELKLKYIIESNKDKELKTNDMRESKVNELVKGDLEIQSIYQEINPITRRINILKIDVDNMEMKYKAFKYSVGSVLL